ncbi:MAG: hypothetical protein CHACPFDD_03783 [Phycisphaerae bacterium]|nr:hypothetical protein [Phycisphaerae bacterium]
MSQTPAATNGESAAVPADPPSYRLGLVGMSLCGALSVGSSEFSIAPLKVGILIGLTLVVGVAVLVRHRTARGLIGRVIASLAAAAALMATAYEIQGWNIPAVLALSHFFNVIVIIKLLDQRTARDDAELLVASLFMLVVGGIVSGHLTYGAYLVGYLILGVHTITLLHIKHERERIGHLSGRSLAGGRVFAASVDRLQHAPGGVMLPTLTLGLVTAVSVFLLCPRLSTGIFGHSATPLSLSVTGFAERVRFGDISEIKKSQRPVMRVELLINGESVGSPGLQLYYRGTTLDLYDGREWYASRPSSFQPARPRGPMIAGFRPGPADNLLEQRITLSASATNHLFAVYVPYDVDLPGDMNLLYRPGDRALLLPDRPRDGITYSVRSVTRSTPRLAARLSEDARSAGRGPRNVPWRGIRAPAPIPPIDQVVSARVQQYVRDLLSDSPPATDAPGRRAVAERICNHLLSDRFSYSLDRSDVDRRAESTEDFLFRRRRGHCEYFASAMAVMCQLAGLQARVVNGYRGGEWNAAGGYYIVASQDAHSWVEVELDDGDWALFDPTPGSVNVNRADDSLLSTVMSIFGHLQVLWADVVVSYSAASRENLIANFRDWLAGLGKQGSLGREIVYAARELLLGPEGLALRYRLMYWATIALCLFAAFMAMRLASRPLRRLWRRVKRIGGQPRRRPAAELFYLRTLETLAELGHRKEASATPLEFTSRLAEREERFAELPLLAREYYRVHFGARPLSREQRRRIDRILARLSAPPPAG